MREHEAVRLVCEHTFDSVMLYDDRHRENAALIALLRRGRRAWHQYAEMVEARGSALGVLLEPDPEATAAPTLFRVDPEAEAEPADLDAIAEELRRWETDGISILTVLDDDYPANLRTIHNRPPFIRFRGKLAAGDERSVAVVGTRRASGEGLRRAGEVAAGLVPGGPAAAQPGADGQAPQP
jgi:DNA processing protein